MKNILLILFFPALLCGQDKILNLPPSAERMISQLREFETDQRNAAEKRIAEQTSKVIESLKQMSIVEGKKGNVDGVVALQKAIDKNALDPFSTPTGPPIGTSLVGTTKTPEPFYVGQCWTNGQAADEGYVFKRSGKGERTFNKNVWEFTWQSHKANVVDITIGGILKRVELDNATGKGTATEVDNPAKVERLTRKGS